jgi:hypothetical protein
MAKRTTVGATRGGVNGFYQQCLSLLFIRGQHLVHSRNRSQAVLMPPPYSRPAAGRRRRSTRAGERASPTTAKARPASREILPSGANHPDAASSPPRRSRYPDEHRQSMFHVDGRTRPNRRRSQSDPKGHSTCSIDPSDVDAKATLTSPVAMLSGTPSIAAFVHLATCSQPHNSRPPCVPTRAVA